MLFYVVRKVRKCIFLKIRLNEADYKFIDCLFVGKLTFPVYFFQIKQVLIFYFIFVETHFEI